MDLLQTIFFTLIALGVLVTFHEFGHFWVARRCGVKVERFSIGFGKSLMTWRDKHETEFVIAILPLGGYVKMLDGREADLTEQDLTHAFNHKTVWQRMAIISAGPIANFILAAVFFWLIFFQGERGLAPIVGDVKENSLASRAGIESGMEIVAIDGVKTPTLNSVSRELFQFVGTSGEIPITVSYGNSNLHYDLSIIIESWLRGEENPMPLRELGIGPLLALEGLRLVAVSEGGPAHSAGLRQGDMLVSLEGESIKSISAFVNRIADSAGINLNVGLERAGVREGERQFMTVQVMPEAVQRDGKYQGQLGIQLAAVGTYPETSIRIREYGPLEALTRSVQETYETTGFVLTSLGKLLVGELSAKNLSGPITIAKVAGDSARAGMDNFIRFIAILSIMLGVMNLLPIPVLDGGHLVYCMVELIKGSPVSDQVQMLGYKVGFIMLMGLMVFATVNDLMRPF